MKVFVHIGYFKTGTTALQQFLEEQRLALRDKGICYPSAGKPVNNWGLTILANGLIESAGMHVPAWYRRGKERKPELYDPHARWAEAVRQLKESGCDLGIISSEAFIRFADAPQPVEMIEFVRRQLADFDVRIVCYLRRPDNYLVSWYRQLVSSGDRIPRLAANIEHYIPSIHINYIRALRPWIDVFGTQRILVRNYDGMRKRGFGTAEDFGALCGFAPTAAESGALGTVHRSLPSALVELKRRHNHRARDAADLRSANRALRFIRENVALPEDDEVEILSLANKERLLEAFLPCHRELTRLWGRGNAFFPDLEKQVMHHPSTMTDTEAAARYSDMFSLVLDELAASGARHHRFGTKMREGKSGPSPSGEGGHSAGN